MDVHELFREIEEEYKRELSNMFSDVILVGRVYRDRFIVLTGDYMHRVVTACAISSSMGFVVVNLPLYTALSVLDRSVRHYEMWYESGIWIIDVGV